MTPVFMVQGSETTIGKRFLRLKLTLHKNANSSSEDSLFFGLEQGGMLIFGYKNVL
jgi:hypothetical protein